ncbi:MAG: hypothetical protein JXR59_02440 [Desulfuromonadaceae bacterium]|nr:hypothetical protein [Desulfuromonadaceae bacterium]
MLRWILIFALLTSLAFICFGPSISGELITVDDLELVGSIKNRSTWNIEGTFIRKNSVGMYYRPISTLSFTANKMLFGNDTRVLHITNLSLHLLNSILVFFLSLKLFSLVQFRQTFSVICAFLYLCHPLTAESVNWISGRTDILAATFVYSSALAFLSFKKNRNINFLLVSIFMFVGGVLAKETAVAFLAGFFFLYRAKKIAIKVNAKTYFRQLVGLFLILACMAGLVYFTVFQLRHFVLKDDSSQIALTWRIMDSNWQYSLFKCLGAFGFYVKKMFFPYPLNFAILEIDPLYELFAVPIVLGLLFLFVKRSNPGSFMLTSAALISPAFPIAFGQIAWTPYAERYVYIALGFSIPATIFYVQMIKISRRAVVTFLFVLIIMYAITTFLRSFQWRTNETLWADTVSKSPLSEMAWNNYGIAQAKNGKYSEAEKIFSRAALVDKRDFYYVDKYDLNTALTMLERGHFNPAVEKLFSVISKSNGRSERAYNLLIKIVENNEIDKGRLFDRYKKYLDRCFIETGKPGFLYQRGLLEKYEMNTELACQYFSRAETIARETDPVVHKKALTALTGCSE